MDHTVLLYGATGYSGRLIAAEGARTGVANGDGGSEYRMILAGRDGGAVAKLADAHGMEHRVFGIDDRMAVVHGLTDVDVVINAAGPFALTASHLAKGALSAGCHYVDINGEAEVYMKLDDLGRHAALRERAMVASAGHTAAASDLLLRVALEHLRTASRATVSDARPVELGAIRIAFSRITSLSRGSLETLWRATREQVRLIRMADRRYAGKPLGKEHVIWHEPVGKLERTFDFYDPHDRLRAKKKNAQGRELQVASAVNLVDTLTARLTVERNNFAAHKIESYVEAGTLGRMAYQLGPLLTPLAAMSWARDLVRLQLNGFPSGPTREERRDETHLVVLEIEDIFQGTLLHWAWHTPNPYTFTARVVVEVAKRVVASPQVGWLTPSEVLQPSRADLCGSAPYLRGCDLVERAVPEMA